MLMCIMSCLWLLLSEVFGCYVGKDKNVQKLNVWHEDQKLASLHTLAHGLKLFVLICMLFEVGIYGNLGHLRSQKISNMTI